MTSQYKTLGTCLPLTYVLCEFGISKNIETHQAIPMAIHAYRGAKMKGQGFWVYREDYDFEK
jgi:hypothetical protein